MVSKRLIWVTGPTVACWISVQRPSRPHSPVMMGQVRSLRGMQQVRSTWQCSGRFQGHGRSSVSGCVASARPSCQRSSKSLRGNVTIGLSFVCSGRVLPIPEISCRNRDPRSRSSPHSRMPTAAASGSLDGDYKALQNIAAQRRQNRVVLCPWVSAGISNATVPASHCAAICRRALISWCARTCLMAGPCVWRIRYAKICGGRCKGCGGFHPSYVWSGLRMVGGCWRAGVLPVRYRQP